MQFLTAQISRYTWSKSYILSLSEWVWEFHNAGWLDTYLKVIDIAFQNQGQVVVTVKTCLFMVFFQSYLNTIAKINTLYILT